MIAQLGPERTNNITVVGEAEVGNSAYGQFVLGAGVSGGIDEQLSIEVSKAGRLYVHESFFNSVYANEYNGFILFGV